MRQVCDLRGRATCCISIDESVWLWKNFGTYMREHSFSKRATAEFIGTAFLVATVVGSGITAERLAGGNVALALLANTLATGAVLVALIFTFGGISGAHFNPVVTLAEASQGGLEWREAMAYLAAQIAGAFMGVGVAH